MINKIISGGQTGGDREDLFGLHITLGSLIRRRFGLWSGNPELLESCAKEVGNERITADEASAIIRELWKRLRKTHSLRAVE